MDLGSVLESEVEQKLMEIRYIKSTYRRKRVSKENNSVFKVLLANIT